MTSSEQRQAAVEVKAKAGLYDVENIVRREHHAVKLADFVLATVPLDDDTPADFEWLTQQCEREDGEDYVWWNNGCISFTCVDHQPDPGETWVTVADDWQVEGEKLPKALTPKTRGEFRKLCELANGTTKKA